MTAIDSELEDGERVVIEPFDSEAEQHCIMHQGECWNSVEVLKVRILMERKRTKLVMHGTPNHFPLLSTFAHEIVIHHPTEQPDSYEDAIDPKSFTLLPTVSAPGALDLSRSHESVVPDSTEGWPAILKEADAAVSDFETAQRFARPKIFIRRSSIAMMKKMAAEGLLHKSGSIVAEMKTYEGAHGEKWTRKLRELCEAFGIPVAWDRTKNRDLFLASGDHYMALQVLGALTLDWSWVCYGGSSQILSFFPVKTLLLSDALVQQKLCRALALARFGTWGHTFPFFNDYVFFSDFEKSPKDVKRFIR